MKTPTLDNRTKAELMEQFARMAAEYVPEWHYTGDTTDPGGALAELFGEMFSQTVDRFNGVPHRLYTEFLRLLGVRAPALTPAQGLVQFRVHEGVEEEVPVPAGSLLFAREESGAYIVYETERAISATPARLSGLYYADGAGGLIQRLELSHPQPFFAPVEGENLQQHRVCVGCTDLLTLSGPCEVEVELLTQTPLLDEGMARKLADPAFARWSWPGEEGDVPFDRVERQGRRLLLTRSGSGVMRPDEQGVIRLSCTMGAGGGTLEVDGVRLRSRPLDEVAADELAFGDVPIEPAAGGYCFGRRPAPYDLFYIRSDEVFCKRGASVRLRLELAPVMDSQEDSAPHYEFGRAIIDKKDAVSILPDDVFVQEVVWEYYNGRGWAPLVVEGSRNPFAMRESAQPELRFTVPEDLVPAPVNAREGCFIRARVVEVANSLSLHPRWILPFVRRVSFQWQYEQGRPAQTLWARSDGREWAVDGTAGIERLAFPLYREELERRRAMYLCFDRPVQGMPLSLMLDVQGSFPTLGKLLWECWDGEGFRPVRALDSTDGLSRAGVACLYLGEPPAEGELFGQRGWWLRLSAARLPAEGQGGPLLAAVHTNVVGAVQRRQMPEQRFTTRGYEVNKTIRLSDSPVMACEVWVDEGATLTAAELERLPAADVRPVREGGALRACPVRWRQVDSLARGGPDERIYELDSHNGVIRFGDGKTGRVPPAGFENIVVYSACGGGSRGNQPRGAVQDFLVSVPRIGSLENLTPMGGGTDRMDSGRLEELGNRRLRHRGRAVGLRDYEELVLEHFNQVSHVCCHSGMDERGEPRPGHLCVVILGSGTEDMADERVLCGKVYDFLSARCDCTLAQSGRLHVRAATETAIHVDVQVLLHRPDQAAESQEDIVQALSRLIDGLWRSREIGRQIRLEELYAAVRGVANVAAVGRLSVEGSWYADGRRQVCPIEGDSRLPFAAVRSGSHRVRIG